MAIIFAALGVNLPEVLISPISMIGDIALPLSLLTLGATISFKHSPVNLGHVFSASLIKSLVIPIIFIPISYLIGFRGTDMILCLILFATPTAISSFPMAYQMGADHNLSGMIIALTNILSILTLLLLIYLLRLLAII